MNDDMPKMVPIDGMLALVEALIEVVGAENEALALGTPVAMTGMLKTKTVLGLKLEHQVRMVRSGVPLDPEAPQALRERLVERGQALTSLMDENATLLRAAMVSTRRRIDAVMRALREQEAPAGPYSASGRRPSANAAPAGGRMV